MAQVGHKVKVSALQVAPVLFTVWPYFSNSLYKRVNTLTKCIIIVNVAVWVIDVQEGASRTFCVFGVIGIVTDVDLVVLE